MNGNTKNIVLASVLILVASATAINLAFAADSALARLVGKAAWYLPFAALVGAAKSLILAFPRG